MSSSYFDAQPAKAPPQAALLDIPHGSGLANSSLLSPQVSRILEDLDLDEKSSSEDQDDNASLSGDKSDKDTSRDRKSRRDQAEHDYTIRKSQTSPFPRGSKTQSKSSSHRPGLNSQKNPHLARFHSLRSMLFSSQIEDNIQKHNESEMQAQAEAKWKAEHDLRKGLNRPKTPEGQALPKEGLAKRMTSGLKRMASKNSPPPMARIAEDNASTASDDDEGGASPSNEEDINHSDVEDLVRWVSRRDPPSDGEARRLQGDAGNKISKTDSGHESLGHSDVEDLVRWVSRKDETKSKNAKKADLDSTTLPSAETAQNHHPYSDASTESDSENGARPAGHRDSINEDDVDDLVRWVSRREGPNAGPVRKSQEEGSTSSPTGSEAPDSNTEELVRWVTKQDDTSGESDNASTHSLPDIAAPVGKASASPRRGSTLKRELSHTQPAAMESETALTHDDVDDLVQWVTRKNPDTQEVEKRDDEIFEWKREQDSKQAVQAQRLT